MILLIGLVVFYYFNVKVTEPEVEELVQPMEVEQAGKDFYKANNGSWLKKTDNGIWELYLTGEPYELGTAFGDLTEELNYEKEKAFVGEIKNRVPSPSYLNFLKYLVGWFNRDLDEYVPMEFQKEIYGSSAYMSDEFDYISPKYQRQLSYHAAHDIGHMLQNMNLVGCTSFATWDKRSENGKLIIGRNFDFYFGQEFAKDPIVAFYKPEDGYKFMSVTWAGFSGVVSGMNEKGLTITLNAAKSDFPLKGKTPVSLIARQILQYASTIDEAYTIAEEYESFIAETFLIGSKIDGKVGLIEKSPTKTALFVQNNDELIATNHFQSEALKGDSLNIEYLNEGVSDYRYDRVQQLIDSVGVGSMDVLSAAKILRDKNGLDGENIGLGNEKAINQLIAHHSIIFSPEDMKVWVSTPPYNLGDYLGYDLNEIFNKDMENNTVFSHADSLTIPADTFLTSGEYQETYDIFMDVKERIQQYFFNGKDPQLTAEELERFKASNPNSYLTYYYLGDYLKDQGEYEEAIANYEKGLSLEIAKNSERHHMEEGLKACKELMQQPK